MPDADLVIGREDERVALDRFLGLIPDGAAAGILRGPGGIGKSTLAEHASRAAEARGLRVLTARPSG